MQDKKYERQNKLDDGGKKSEKKWLSNQFEMKKRQVVNNDITHPF